MIEIVLVIIGTVLTLISFFVTEKIDAGNTMDISAMSSISEEVMRQKIDEAAQNAVDETVEKTEAMLDKISNEKIMAVNDYSDSVLKEINKNHDEVMFLYSMLNDKEKDIKNTVRDIENVKKTVKMIKEENISDEPENSIIEEEPPVEETAEVEETPRPANSEMNNNQRILDMHSNGISDIEIAKTLGIGIGEVRLVIDLFRK